MPYKQLLVNKESPLGIITINKPQVLNALNSEVLRELKQAMLEMEADKTVKVVILTGAGEKAFVAGADIAEMANLDAQGGREFSLLGHEVFELIENLGKPVIAAVNGFALGGGCELAMACDMRVVSEKARFGQPEVNLGIVPGFGGTQRLLRLAGKGAAKMLIMSARMVNAQEALRIGLADMVTPAGELLEETRKLALEIAGKSQNAVKTAKQLINAGQEMGLRAANQFEAIKFGDCFSNPEQKEGMTAFLEKRPAKF